MKKFSVFDLGALIIWILPAFYLFFIYASLPAQMPLHYDIHGNVNSYGSKSEFVFFQVLIIGISALVYFLMKFLPLIDPKRQVKYGEATFHKLAIGMVVFFAALNLVIIFASVHHGFQIDKLLYPVISLLFVFLGNLMYSIKPNYFAGIKTPWTLESEDNWRATHRLASKIWFWGGIALTPLTLLLPSQTAGIVFLVFVLVMGLVPVIYSYLYFRKHNLNQN